MADPKIDITGYPLPNEDGEINDFAYHEARESKYFNAKRKVIFINGMANSGANHTESALALSLVQMCTVIGVFNKSVSGWKDFLQCVGDKNQFDGPVSFSAKTKVAVGVAIKNKTPVETIRGALARDPAQVALFDLLSIKENRRLEIFAHSQGNLILSNALQGIAAAYGSQALAGCVVHTFGSPTVTWPKGVAKYEHGFTWDPVTFLAGFDTSWSISKVGMPKGSLNPVTHGFLEYLKQDPSFVVNRFRWGGLKMTFNMDEEGLASALAAMGTNLGRVHKIFQHLNDKHNSDADDVALEYVALARKSPLLIGALRQEKPLVNLLIQILDEGWTSNDEKQAIAFLRSL